MTMDDQAGKRRRKRRRWKCKKCGSDAEVSWSKNESGFSVTRKRKCLNGDCGRTVFTVEIEKEELENLKMEIARLSGRVSG